MCSSQSWFFGGASEVLLLWSPYYAQPGEGYRQMLYLPEFSSPHIPATIPTTMPVTIGQDTP